MQTKIKILAGLAAMVMSMTLLSACQDKTASAPDESTTMVQTQPPSTTTDNETRKEPEQHATLVADMSFGSDNADLISKYEYGYNGTLTVEMMAQGLSELTGLNFAIKESATSANSVSIDWALDATFIAGLGEIPQKDEFHMYDGESLTWFMLNSMYRTILENNGGDLEVYYSMDGWKPLMNEVFAPDGFPVDMPYTGSHGGRGDTIDDDSGSNLGYAEEYTIQGDLGDYLNASEAAKLTFDTMRDHGNIPEYSDETQYTMTLVDLVDIEGEECYLYRLDPDEPTGTIGAAYAYAYQSGNIYMQGQGGQWVQPVEG